jgi:hypothetical protein
MWWGNPRVEFRMENVAETAAQQISRKSHQGRPAGYTDAEWELSRKSHGRSRVGNGAKLLPLTDGRSASYRRFKDLVEDIAADLGGKQNLSEGQRQLIRRAAMLSAECERQEALAARGEAEFNCELYGMMCDRLGRLFGRLGLERVARPVNDGSRALVDYFAVPSAKDAVP